MNKQLVLIFFFFCYFDYIIVWLIFFHVLLNAFDKENLGFIAFLIIVELAAMLLPQVLRVQQFSTAWALGLDRRAQTIYRFLLLRSTNSLLWQIELYLWLSTSLFWIELERSFGVGWRFSDLPFVMSLYRKQVSHLWFTSTLFQNLLLWR